MSLLLAIESSCDEMAMAVLKDQREFCFKRNVKTSKYKNGRP